MVKENNNLLPIEVNNKPFETVQEVGEKYEILSYEEFMKNYENDESITSSYNDELGSYGNVGVEKPSGPCYVCDKPTRWVDLYLPCPGIKNGRACKNNTNKMRWVHSSCGSTSEISNKAHIRCSRSNCSADYHMSYWNFSCSEHRGDYWSTDKVNFSKSLGWVLGLDHYGDMVDDIIVYMSNHKNEARSGW